MSDFKFGLKLKAKTIGEFDVGHPEQYNLLIKPQFKDDTLFVHFICHFKRPLTDEEKANGVTHPPITMDIVTGFLKEAKFIPESKNNYTSFSEEPILKIYERYVKEFTELGFIKHEEMYLGVESQEPSYHAAGQGGGKIDIQKAFMQMGIGGLSNPAIKAKQPKMMVLPMKPTNTNTNP